MYKNFFTELEYSIAKDYIHTEIQAIAKRVPKYNQYCEKMSNQYKLFLKEGVEFDSNNKIGKDAIQNFVIKPTHTNSPVFIEMIKYLKKTKDFIEYLEKANGEFLSSNLSVRDYITKTRNLVNQSFDHVYKLTANNNQFIPTSECFQKLKNHAHQLDGILTKVQHELLRSKVISLYNSR